MYGADNVSDNGADGRVSECFAHLGIYDLILPQYERYVNKNVKNSLLYVRVMLKYL